MTRSSAPSSCRTCARASARPRSSAAPTWPCSRGERVAIIGPNGAGKSTLFNLISGRFGASSGEILLNGQRINGLSAVRDQPPRPVAQLPGHQHLSRGCRCSRTSAARVLWSLGYRYTFWQFLADLHDANERAEEVLEHDQAATASATCWR